MNVCFCLLTLHNRKTVNAKDETCNESETSVKLWTYSKKQTIIQLIHKSFNRYLNIIFGFEHKKHNAVSKSWAPPQVVR